MCVPSFYLNSSISKNVLNQKHRRVKNILYIFNVNVPTLNTGQFICLLYTKTSGFEI